MSESMISGRVAIQTVGRALKYSLRYDFELAVKGMTQATSIFWILLLPLTGKAIVDFIVVRDISPPSDANVPFFFLPIIDFMLTLTVYETAFFLGVLFITMLVLVGAYGTDGAQRSSAVAWLAEGEDIATRSENAANNMHSLVSGLYGLFESLWHIRVAQRLNHTLRSDIFHRFKSHSITELSNRANGDVVYRAMYDTPGVSNIIFNLWVGPVTSFVNLVTTILVMFVIFRNEPVVVWGAIAVGPLNFMLMLYIAKLSRRYGTLAREAGSKATAVIEEGLANMMAVQGIGSTDIYVEKFREASWFSFSRFRQVVLVGISGNFIGFVIGANMVYIVFYYLAVPFINQEYSPGDWFVIWGYYGAISASAGWLGRLWLTLQEGIAGMHRVFMILDSELENVDPVSQLHASDSSLALTQSIQLEDVSYSYPGGREVLRDINLHANIGEMIAISGPTGAGKTTLAYLIPALISPTKGRLLVDGIEPNEGDLIRLREQVSFVFQETSVFNDTIANNIRMGRRDAAISDVQEAARVAGAHEFIEVLPEGYETNLGKAGAKLSVGQKQRIAIARALVSNKPVLILDEPTAALDPRTENELVRSLSMARQGRIVIVIAHRLSTIRAADRIYVMDDGAIVESGDHQSLIDQDGIYARFVSLQTA
ncbi:MAG: ABC transporter ATP-binding protein [Gammaproteobacteria bacterium]|nr:ABC transporter ATP-binding protein [Gammaproteobacteria bacterium]